VEFAVLWKESRVFRQVVTFQRCIVPPGSGNKLKDTEKSLHRGRAHESTLRLRDGATCARMMLNSMVEEVNSATETDEGRKCVRWILENAARSSETLIRANGIKFQYRDHFRKSGCTVFRIS
jgi:hypothetical protein